MKNLAQCDDPEVIGCIEQNRGAIVKTALLRSLPPERHTVLANALANRTLDYLMASLSYRDDQSLNDWVADSLRNGLAREQALFNLFAACVSASLDIMMREIGYLGAPVYAWLETVQRRIDLTVGAARLEFNEERFALDSIDAKIDEVLYKLSERDTLTAEHSHSVGLWCTRIAKQLGLSRNETLLVSRSGLVHDIGKITTPLEILTAERALDDDEWVIMRRHTLEGVAMLETVPELQDMLPAVRWHHERMDGRGYPDGLDGTRIPLSARIVSVADAFNAMVARRPYREPLSPIVAIEELKRHSGSHFDTPIVTALVEVVNAF